MKRMSVGTTVPKPQALGLDKVARLAGMSRSRMIQLMVGSVNDPELAPIVVGAALAHLKKEVAGVADATEALMRGAGEPRS